jgi:uncharacterized membrane protein YphA (DoxX/SURF4 family)
MSVLSAVLQTLLILYYLFSGISKIAGVKYWADIFEHLGLPAWFRVVTGLVQLVGAAGLIIGFWYADAVAWAAIWLGVTMLFAILAHLRVKDPFGKTAAAVVFAVLNIGLLLVHVA